MFVAMLVYLVLVLIRPQDYPAMVDANLLPWQPVALIVAALFWLLSVRKRFDAPLWNAVGTPLDDMFTLAGERTLDLVCAIEINEWNGSRSIQLKLEDARLVEAMEPMVEHVPF